MDLSNWKWKNSCFSGIKRNCRRDRNWFVLHSSNLSWAPYYISPSSTGISLLTITSKHLTGCEVALRHQCRRFIVKWGAVLNSWLNCKVDSCTFWVNQISQISIGRKQKIFFVFQLHTVVKLFFNDTTIFKTKHRNQIQPEDDISCALTATSPYFDKLVKQTQRQDCHWNLWMWEINQIC